MPNTYTPIATQTVTSGATLTFSSIPATYTDLVLIINGGTLSQGDNVWLRFNSDSATNYSVNELRGSGSTIVLGNASNKTFVSLSYNIGGARNLAQNFIANIMNYSNSTTFKTVISRVNQPDSGSSYPGVGVLTNTWRSTSAISSVTVGRTGGGDLAVGSTITLYGIKAA